MAEIAELSESSAVSKYPHLKYESLISKYPIISIEDGLVEDDWDG